MDEMTDRFRSNGLYKWLGFLIDFLTIESNVIIEVVIDLNSSHPY